MIQEKILDLEESVIGKSSASWAQERNITLTYLGMCISLIYSLYSFMNIISEEGTSTKVIIFAILVFLASFLAVYLTVTSILKLSFRKKPYYYNPRFNQCLDYLLCNQWIWSFRLD